MLREPIQICKFLWLSHFTPNIQGYDTVTLGHILMAVFCDFLNHPTYWLLFLEYAPEWNLGATIYCMYGICTLDHITTAKCLCVLKKISYANVFEIPMRGNLLIYLYVCQCCLKYSAWGVSCAYLMLRGQHETSLKHWIVMTVQWKAWFRIYSFLLHYCSIKYETKRGVTKVMFDMLTFILKLNLILFW